MNHQHPNRHCNTNCDNDCLDAAAVTAASPSVSTVVALQEDGTGVVVPPSPSTSTTVILLPTTTDPSRTFHMTEEVEEEDDDNDSNKGDGIELTIDEATNSATTTTSNTTSPMVTTAINHPVTTTTTTVAISSRTTHNRSPFVTRTMEYIKYIYSTLLLLFSIVIVMYTILTQQTVATTTTTSSSNSTGSTSSTLNVYIAALCFWICIVWLAIMEGTQGAVVGLQSVRPISYQTSHPRTYQNTQLIYSSNSSSTNTNQNHDRETPNHNRLERFIIGRQFLVVLVVFILNTLSTSIPDATLWFVNNDDDDDDDDDDTTHPFINVITNIFVDNGVATILITIIVGQLIAQIVSSHCMLDFMNNYLVYGTERISLWVESSGLLHAVYIVQRLLLMTTSSNHQRYKRDSDGNIDHNNAHGSDTDHNHNIAANHNATDQSYGSINSSGNSSKSLCTVPTTKPSEAVFVLVATNIFFWFRVLMSIGILTLSFAVTLSALVQNQTKMWDGVPVPISIVLFIVLMMMVGMLEGLQIALFAVIRRSDVEVRQHPMAYQNRQLILSKSQNLPAFLIGRQILVTGCTFIVARITAVDVDVDTDRNIFGVSDPLQTFFNTGLLGAIITTIMASLIWRIIAASYPIVFLSNPIVYILIRLCLYIEMSGICSSAWILAYVHTKLMNYKNDEIYMSGSHDENDDNDELYEQNSKNSMLGFDLEVNVPTTTTTTTTP